MGVERAKARRLLRLAAAAPVAAYFAFFAAFAVDIPFGDDYPTLAFVINSTNPDWPAGKAAQILGQHNEHRIATLRLTLLALYALRGEIDFVLVAFLGNLAAVGIALVLFRGVRGSAGGEPLFLFLPVLFLLFQPQHFQLMFWAMCAFTNVVVIFLSFLSLDLLAGKTAGERRGAAFGGALVLAVAAAYTNGNGLFVFIAGAAVLLVRKRLRRLGIWLLAGGLTAAFYFRGYVKNPAHPDILPYLKDRFFGVVEYFLSVAGAWADFGVLRPHASVIAGLLVMAGLVLLAARGLLKKSPFLSGAVLFVLASLAALTWTRAPFGVLQSYEPRYKFLAVVLLALLFLGWIAVAREKEKRAAGVGFIVFSVVFSGLSYFRNFARGRDYGPVLAVTLVRWSEGEADLPCADQEHGEAILRLAVQRRIYEPPSELNILRPKFPFGAIDPAAGTPGAAPEGEVVVSGWALDNGGPPRIVVRRNARPGEPISLLNKKRLAYVGRARCAAGSAADVARVYYGFPGREEMLWRFSFRPADFAGGPLEGTTLFFFARDRAGRENLIGTVDVPGE